MGDTKDMQEKVAFVNIVDFRTPSSFVVDILNHLKTWKLPSEAIAKVDENSKLVQRAHEIPSIFGYDFQYTLSRRPAPTHPSSFLAAVIPTHLSAVFSSLLISSSVLQSSPIAHLPPSGPSLRFQVPGQTVLFPLFYTVESWCLERFWSWRQDSSAVPQNREPLRKTKRKKLNWGQRWISVLVSRKPR